MTALVRHTTYSTSQTYGAERYYLEVTIVGKGSSAPVVKATNDATNPPCSAEIASIVRNSAGNYTITLYDAYYAVAYCSGDIDDTSALGAYATIGSWGNLQTSTPATFVLMTWNASGSTPTDIPNNTACRISIAFKKTYTGAAA